MERQVGCVGCFQKEVSKLDQSTTEGLVVENQKIEVSPELRTFRNLPVVILTRNM